MKRTASVAAIILTAGAAPAANSAPFDWTGFYTGFSLGHVSGQEHDNQSAVVPPVQNQPVPAAATGGSGTTGGVSGRNGPGGTTASTHDPNVSALINDSLHLNGFIGGVHAGYDVQMDRFVLGLEGDLDYSGFGGGQDGVYNGGADPRRLDFESRWQGSFRVRAGFTPSDRLLLYATGGVAIAQGRLSNSGSHNGSAIPATVATATHVGWTAGIGAGYALSSHWIGSIELRYSDFGNRSYHTRDGPVSVGWRQVSSMVGMSYKF